MNLSQYFESVVDVRVSKTCTNMSEAFNSTCILFKKNASGSRPWMSTHSIPAVLVSCCYSTKVADYVSMQYVLVADSWNVYGSQTFYVKFS